MKRGRWTIPAISGALVVGSFAASWALTATGHPTAARATADALMVAAAVVAGLPIALTAIRALGAKVVGIDLLVTVATTGALVIGEYWEAAAVTFLFAVGHALEDATLKRTRRALTELIAVAPDLAVVLRDGQQQEVPAAAVVVGETVLVKNGAKVPVDGEVSGGVGVLDESTITGESLPVEKGSGDRVFAGTISRGGLLQVRATGVGADTTLARIIHRVEEAQDAKAPTQAFLDRFAAWYTPGIIVAAALAGVLTGDIVLALTLLVISCPGALVISIPVAVVAGIGRGARDGILIKGGQYLEAAARISAVALDKTGTLTWGRPVLAEVVVLDPALDRGDVLLAAARAEAGSEHPLARPVVAAAAGAGWEIGELGEVESVPGQGIVADVGGGRVHVGSTALLARAGIAPGGAERVADRLARDGLTPMVVAIDGRVAGVLAVADQVRPDAAGMVTGLRAAGVAEVVMLTGDAAPVARGVGRQVGITDVRAGLLPEDKLTAVRELQSLGHTVAMVGDGVNDAPALAAADLGVAMGAAGTGVAIETADIALMGDDLRRLPRAVALARRTARVMRQNIAVALATVALLVAGVLAGGVTMSLGMLVHEASVLVVIGNAMRLLRSVRGADVVGRDVGAAGTARYLRDEPRVVVPGGTEG